MLPPPFPSGCLAEAERQGQAASYTVSFRDDLGGWIRVSYRVHGGGALEIERVHSDAVGNVSTEALSCPVPEDGMRADWPYASCPTA